MGPPIVGGECVIEPTLVEGVKDAVDVIPGADHSCAQIKDGTLRCWGGLEPMPGEP